MRVREITIEVIPYSWKKEGIYVIPYL